MIVFTQYRQLKPLILFHHASRATLLALPPPLPITSTWQIVCTWSRCLEDGDLIEPSYPVHKTAKREITKAINYLDSKADYWQRYKPIYARVGDRGVEKKRATGEELALQVREG